MKSDPQPACHPATVRPPRALLLATAILLAAGCVHRGTDAAPVVDSAAATVPAEPEPEAAVGDRAPSADAGAGGPALDAAEAAEVERLLDRAERAIANDHLTYPSTGSALALYDRVRILDPDNESARRGLERIVERYLELAIGAAEQRRFSDARAMLDRAYIVDPEHAGIAPTRAQIALLDDAERHVIALDGEQLRNRDPALQDTLRQAGATSRGQGCRAEITARNDSEGRWIYQQMSAGGGQTRIQAHLNIGSPPRIEVLCFRP